jgi:histidinol-phosphate aminotransferase
MAESVRLHGGPDAFGVPRFDFSTNSNACGPCPAALAAVHAADPTCYPDPDYQSLREALAVFHQVAPERIVLAGSASEFIFRISALAARTTRSMQASIPASASALPRRWQRPAAVHLPPFHYGDYAQAALAWGLQAVSDPDQADLLWACDPSSPLGQSHDRLAQQVQGLRSDQRLVLDCAYRPLRLEGRLALDSEGLDRVWQLWTPNKALGLTGVRAAYAIAPRGAGEQVEALQALAPSWPVGAHGVAMLQAWTLPAVQDWLAASLETLRVWKCRQLDLCHTLGWQTRPSDANYFVALPERPDRPGLGADLTLLRARGIKLRDATSFGLPGAVRLGVLAPEAQDALAQAWTSIRHLT